MTLLLDTNILLWAASGDSQLPAKAAALIQDPSNVLAFSAANIWEVVIKSALGRDDFKANPQVLRSKLLSNGYEELAISGKHALFVSSLPDLHKDPFDRILIAQALVEGMTLVTSDAQLSGYSSSILTF